MGSRANDLTGNSQNLKVLNGIKRSFTVWLVVRLEVKIISITFISFIFSFILFTDKRLPVQPVSLTLTLILTENSEILRIT